MTKRGPRPDLAERNRQRATHGMSHTPTFYTWRSMLQRCLNERCKDYARYGARGITVHSSWLDFAVFLADMGVRPEGTTLDRIDNDGPYAPGNCRWSSAREQSSNRRTTRLLTFNGRAQTIAAWARELGTSRQTLRNRLEQGWTVEAALTVSVNYSNGRNGYGRSAHHH
jgi:hypothetical protein